MKAEWQYMLVERMEPPTQTAGGLFLPSDEKDPLYVVRVVSFGAGQVGESGVLAPLQVRERRRRGWRCPPFDET